MKIDYKLELLSKETTKLLGRTAKVIGKDKNGENVPKLEIVDVILMHCNVVNNSVIKKHQTFQLYLCLRNNLDY